MSAIGETRQPETARSRTRWPATLLRRLLGLALVGCVLVALLAIGLAWRLAQGPLDVTWMVRAAETMMKPGDPAARIRVGRASIAWNGFNGGARSGLELRLHDVQSATAGGAAGASIGRADVTLAPMPLLAATIAPRSIVLDEVRLRAVRGADGVLRFDFGGSAGPGPGGDGFGDLLAELRRPAGSAEADPNLGDLQTVRVEHAWVTLVDEPSQMSIEGEVDGLELRRREGGGVSGDANGHFSVGGARVALSISATLLPDAAMRFEATMAPLGTSSIDTAFLTRLDPALATLGGVDAEIAAHASLDLSAALRPQRGTLLLTSGPGTLTVPNSSPVRFDSLAIDGAAHWDDDSWRPRTLTVETAEAVLVASPTRKSKVRITAAATRQDGAYEAKATLGVDRASFADLAALWPAAWGGHVRPWLTENVTAGEAHDAALTATIAIPIADPAKASVTAAGGTLKADNIAIHWLRPVPPVEHAEAVLTVIGPDELVIAIPRAAQGPIALRDGLLRFTGLSKKDQYMSLTATVQGGVPALIKLLREPRLQLLDAHPVPFTDEAGKVNGRLAVDVPMFDHLQFEQVSIASKGQLTGLRLRGLVAGRDLDRGDVNYDVTQDGLKASGEVTVAGVAGRAEVAMNFKAGPPSEVVEQARLVGRVGLPELAANGIDLGGVLTSGASLLDVTYTEQRDGESRIDVKADLGPAGISVAGWRKAPGPPAQAVAAVLIQGGRIAGVPVLSASGPDLSIVARAETIGGEPRVLRLDRVVLGPTRLTGEIVFPEQAGGPVRVQASGPVLDLADQVRGATKTAETTRSWIADIRFGRVLLGNHRVLTEVAAHAEHLHGRLRTLQITTEGAERLRASIMPAPNGRRLLMHAADTGALLGGLELTNTIQGGVLAVDASFDDRQADPPLNGQLHLTNFSVRDAVVLGKLLQAVTVYGIVDALRDKGVYFSDLRGSFCVCESVLRIGPSQAYSASLGITATGTVDLDRNVMDLNGTIVPAYAINAALGNIPWIGRLFSSERGGGLIAANFKIVGPTDNPGVSVNPLSLLTPGFLRGLFGLFG